MSRGNQLLAFVLALLLVASTALPLSNAYAQEGSLMAAQAASDNADDSGGSAAAEEPTSTPVVYFGVDVTVSVAVQNIGWGDWVEPGAVAGDVNGKGINALKIELTGISGLAGSVNYQTYRRGAGWLDIASDGAATKSVRNVEAVKIELTDQVAQHYDVLYRACVSGVGWRPWAKNGESSGLIDAGKRVTAVQVKLSPKTEEATGQKLKAKGVRYEARFVASGWKAWHGDGETAGNTVGSKKLNGFAVLVDTGKLSGGVKYRAYSQSTGWQSWVKNGNAAGDEAHPLEAIRIKLKGDISKTYDVYYRTYVKGVGWLDWAKNGKPAGSMNLGLHLQAFQVMLVKKAESAPGATQYPTANLLEKTKTLDGIDIASWQAGINVAGVDADFVIVKATGGTGYTNPYYREWADATLASGKMLGLYHYAREDGCASSAAKEAKYFIKAARPYLGRAVLVLDFEGSALDMGNYQSWAKTFMSMVYKKTGVKPLIYLSKYYTWSRDWSSVARKYDLWVAQYPDYNPVYGYLDSPWTDGYGYGNWSAPRMFQYTSSGYISGYGSNLDLNKFYGSALSWRKLAKKG